MTTNELLSSYDIVDGIVTNPGKFKREPAYVPYFWELALEGFVDEDYTDNSGAVYAFEISDDDRAFFVELRDFSRIELRENEQGFVSAKLYSEKNH